MNKLILVFNVLLMFTNAQALTCSDALEDQLSQLPALLTQPRSTDSSVDLDKQCITASMDTFHEWTDSVRAERAAKKLPAIGHYGYCENSQQSKVQREHTPPCKSDLYINVIQNSYHDVLKCLNMNPKKLFAITAVESGFHINTYSLSGQDIGIGQLIPEAIGDVNMFWNDAIAELKESTTPACKNIFSSMASLESAPSSGPEQACAMMALPENPIRNLLYKGLLHQHNEKQMHMFFKQSKMQERLTQLTGEEWTKEELTQLQEVLVFLAYNAGAQGAKNIFESYVTLQESQAIDWDSQYNEFYQNYIDYYLRAMDLGAQGYTKEADELLNERLVMQTKMDELKNDQAGSVIPKSQFFANKTPGSFGEYLLKNKKSEYLNILLKRITFIENELINSPGLCAPPGFLMGQ